MTTQPQRTCCCWGHVHAVLLQRHLVCRWAGAQAQHRHRPAAAGEAQLPRIQRVDGQVPKHLAGASTAAQLTPPQQAAGCGVCVCVCVCVCARAQGRRRRGSR
jgi:hypothetical protein